MRYLSLFSGIEAASVAWEPLGWKPAAFAEIEPFPAAVLAHRFPDVPNLGDVTKYEEWPDIGPIDLICGGSPCQDYSIAGQRLGMAGARGQLTLTYIEIVAHHRPDWLVYENVPGILSSNGGRDFARFLGDLSGQTISVPDGGWKNSGIIPGISDAYGLAFRVLDAQHVRTRRHPWAVPQRRRRVFVVGYLGDWRPAAAVLFDRESLSGNPAPRREAREGSAGRIARSLACRGRGGTPQIEMGGEVANAILTPNGGRAGIGVGAVITSTGDVAHCLNAGGMGRQDYETETMVAHTLKGEGFDASEDGTGRGTPLVPVAFTAKDYGGDAVENVSPTLRAGGHTGSHANAGVMPAVAWALGSHAGAADGDQTNRSHSSGGPVGLGVQEGCAYSLRSGRTQNVATPWAVRRLTPTECARLQGFPDDWARIPWRGKPAEQCPDGPQYRAYGNSMATNVMTWIGERIARVEAML